MQPPGSFVVTGTGGGSDCLMLHVAYNRMVSQTVGRCTIEYPEREILQRELHCVPTGGYRICDGGRVSARCIGCSSFFFKMETRFQWCNADIDCTFITMAYVLYSHPPLLRHITMDPETKGLQLNLSHNRIVGGTLLSDSVVSLANTVDSSTRCIKTSIGSCCTSRKQSFQAEQVGICTDA